MSKGTTMKALRVVLGTAVVVWAIGALAQTTPTPPGPSSARYYYTPTSGVSIATGYDSATGTWKKSCLKELGLG